MNGQGLLLEEIEELDSNGNREEEVDNGVISRDPRSSDDFSDIVVSDPFEEDQGKTEETSIDFDSRNNEGPFERVNEGGGAIFESNTENVIDPLGEVLLYGKFNKKKVYEPELRGRIDKSILHDCNYCSFPYYPKNFIHSSNVKTFSDAFTSFNEEKIIVMTNYKAPGSKFQVHLGLFFLDSNVKENVSITCKKPLGDPHRRSIRFICPIPGEKKWILDHCFKVQVFHNDNNHEILTEPILVRHCSKKELDVKEKGKLAICSMIEDRDRFLLEWIEWHRMVGVEKFYLYFHPGGFHYYDQTFDLLERYFKRGIVHLFVWNYTIPFYARANEHNEDQVAAQNDCFNRWGDHWEWMAMIDDDEFIVPVKSESILDTLDRHVGNQDLGGLMLNSWFYGNERKTNSHLSTEIYSKFKEKKRSYKKTIIQPRNVNYFAVHGITSGKKSTFISEDEAYLAHYFFRKWHDYNPIVENTPNSGSYEENTPLVRLIPKLKERLEVIEREVNVEKFDFHYHDLIE